MGGRFAKHIISWKFVFSARFSEFYRPIKFISGHQFEDFADSIKIIIIVRNEGAKLVLC